MRHLRVLHVLPHGGGGGERYIQLLADRLPCEFETVELARSPQPLRAIPRMARTLPRIGAMARRFDIVNVHGDTAAVLAYPALRGRRWIVTTHGISLLRRQRGLRGRAVTRAIRSAVVGAEVVVCTSITEREELEGLIGKSGAGRLVTIPNGVELPSPVDAGERQSSRQRLGVGEEELAVIYVGELSPHKDPLTAVRAANNLREAGVPLRLLLAGEGSLRDEIERVGGPCVAALGHRDDVRRLYAAADVLVLPSRREGLSLVLLEAMSHGVPAVVSSGPGNREVVADAGVVVPVGDADALAEAVTELWRSPAERVRLGERARRRVAERYTVERVADELLEVYVRVAADSHRRLSRVADEVR